MGNAVASGFGSAWGSTKEYANDPFRKAFDLNWFMRAQRKSLSGLEIGGHSLVDPLNLFKAADKPPPVAAPPPPPDTTASMLREVSRAQTDQQLRQSKRRSFMGGY